jgi:hypothetical protein
VKVYCDNDILLKLAAYDLAELALAALGIPAGEMRVLSTARFTFHGKDAVKGRARFGAEVYDRLHRLLARLSPITDAPDPKWEATMASVPGLDVGEALIFASAAPDTEALVLIGDKRALAALAGDPRCSELAANLAGRILCWEQLLAALLRVAPFATVRDRIAARPEGDTATRIVFGAHGDASEEAVREGLHSYVADLRKQTGRLLRE